MGIGATWRLFRRMQDSLAAVAALAFAACAIHAWGVLPGDAALRLQRIVALPAFCLALSLFAPLAAPPLRRALMGHLWTSYRSGFGQSVASVLGGIAVLLGFGGLIVWQTHRAALSGGRFPGGSFSGYAAGVGLLIAQAVLVRRLEADPDVRRQIEES